MGHLTQEAQKYLRRMPQLVLDQINRLCQEYEQLQQENQYLRQQLQQQQQGGRYQPGQQMGFDYQQPQSHYWGGGWPWYPLFEGGRQAGRDFRPDYGPMYERGYDRPYYRYGNDTYNRTREDSEPYPRETRENPNITTPEAPLRKT